MYQRDHARRNGGERDFRDIREEDLTDDGHSGRASDFADSTLQYGAVVADDGREFPRRGSRDSWSPAAVPGAYPEEDEGESSRYSGSARPPRSADRFLDDPATDYDDPVPAKSGPLRAVWFFLLMAAIGSSAGAVWFYFEPDLGGYVPGFSSANVERTTELLAPLVDGQTKLTQSVTAIQAAQDALQKNTAAREQELQRLLAETQALRTDVNALRAALETALRSRSAQPAKPAPAAAKKPKAERKPAPQQLQPQSESTPTAPPPSQ